MLVPADAVLRLREAVYSKLGGATEEISGLVILPGREQNGEWFTQPVVNFKRVCALMEVIGWSETAGEVDNAEVDFAEHGPLIVEALSEQLAMEHGFLEDDPDPRGKQHKRARHYADVIERFLWTLEGSPS
jgi:hypothetical protein